MMLTKRLFVLFILMSFFSCDSVPDLYKDNQEVIKDSGAPNKANEDNTVFPSGKKYTYNIWIQDANKVKSQIVIVWDATKKQFDWRKERKGDRAEGIENIYPIDKVVLVSHENTEHTNTLNTEVRWEFWNRPHGKLGISEKHHVFEDKEALNMEFPQAYFMEEFSKIPPPNASKNIFVGQKWEYQGVKFQTTAQVYRNTFYGKKLVFLLQGTNKFGKGKYTYHPKYGFLKMEMKNRSGNTLVLELVGREN
ncbi:MAG: hypothetical protein N4A45_05640 [Flavobacteriales bacterium]|jgi:hypothetical protein|nr:hypothetical protein [Flavobacteriales bacterium]